MWNVLRRRALAPMLGAGPFVLLSLVAPCAHAAATVRPSVFHFLSPLPGAEYVRADASLIVRLERAPASGSRALDRALEVTGATSGSHPGIARFARDRRTLLFKPAQPFAYGEEVTVRLAAALARAAGGDGTDYSYTFRIAAGPPPAYTPEPEWAAEVPANMAGAPRGARGLQDLPEDFPEIFAVPNPPAAPGALYISSINFGGLATPYLLVLDDYATPYFYRAMNGPCFDFKLQPNGLATYFDGSTNKFYELDENYSVVDSFACGNSYATDVHELRLASNGHAFLLSYDPEAVDMSQVVPGGNPNAIVTGMVVQELDENKDVVFEWRSWDHYAITDATHENLTAAQIDCVHGNAIEIDTDGRLMVSCRHMDEITKIDLETGDIVWRWGGKHNEFTFVGDTLKFSHQHAIRRLPTGTVTMFDNGNFHTPPFSRAVEYKLDEANRTAEAIWQFRNTPDEFSGAMGYVQRLDNGNTLIGWGAGKPDLTEVTSAGVKTLEMRLPAGIYSYRAFRFPTTLTASVGAGKATDALQLSSPWPSPSHGRATFTLTLEQPAEVTLAAYDLAGRRVREALDHAPLVAGTHPLALDLTGAPPGLYFCRVDAGGMSATRKVLLTR